MLMRIFCLFELNSALTTGAELKFVASAKLRQELSMNLAEKFSELSDLVNKIDVRDCTAKLPHEITDKKVFLGIMSGIEDEVNARLRKEMQRWLCEAAEDVIERTDPRRARLGEAAMAMEVAQTGDWWWRHLRLGRCRGDRWVFLYDILDLTIIDGGARLTRLLEWLPRLPPLVVLLGVVLLAVGAVLQMMACMIIVSPLIVSVIARPIAWLVVGALMVAAGACIGTKCPDLNRNVVEQKPIEFLFCVMSILLGTLFLEWVTQSAEGMATSASGSMISDGATEPMDFAWNAIYNEPSETMYHMALYALVVIGLIVGGSIFSLPLQLGNLLITHQAARQLRQPPLLGDWVTRSGSEWFGLVVGLGCTGIMTGITTLYFFIKYYSEYGHHQEMMMKDGPWSPSGFMMLLPLLGPFVGVMAWACAVQPVQEALIAAAARASLRTKAGVLRLRLGDAEGAAAKLGEAQAELLVMVGPEADLPMHSYNSPHTMGTTYSDTTGGKKCKDAFRELRVALDATVEVLARDACEKEWDEMNKAEHDALVAGGWSEASWEAGNEAPVHVQQLWDVFNVYDINRDGVLDQREVAAMFDAIGYEVDSSYVGGVMDIFGQFDGDGNGSIHMTEFQSLWEHLGGAPFAPADAPVEAPEPTALAPALEAVTLQPGMYMAMVAGAQVRADFASTSQVVGGLEDGQVIEVLECRPNEADQMRVRFDDGHGLGGWISATTKSSGRPVLRPIAGLLEPSRGMVCVVKAEKAVVREGFSHDTALAGYLEAGDVIEIVDVRVNEKNQVRVAFELEDAEHLGWVSMVSASGDVLLEHLALHLLPHPGMAGARWPPTTPGASELHATSVQEENVFKRAILVLKAGAARDVASSSPETMTIESVTETLETFTYGVSLVDDACAVNPSPQVVNALSQKKSEVQNRMIDLEKKLTELEAKKTLEPA